MNSNLIVFSGKTGCGKTSLSKPFAESRGLRWTSFGNAVRSEASRLGLPTDDKRVLQELGQKLVDHEPHKLCEAVFRTLEVASGVLGVLDGLRHKSILDILVEKTGADGLKLIFIDVADALRYERLLTNRGWTAEQCQLYDNDPTEWELDSQLRNLAHVVVKNEGSVESSLSQIELWFATSEKQLMA